MRNGLTAVNLLKSFFNLLCKNKPFDKFLKVLVQSEEFPPPVIVFKEGGLQPEMIKKFRAGLAIAHESPEGRDILQMWQIDCFVPVPESYSASLTDSLKRYPLPPTK